MKNESSPKLWITFFGVLLVLLGIYAAVRTAVNIKLFSDRYPQSGVINTSLFGQPVYYQRETDCNFPFTPVVSPNGELTQPSLDQIKIDKQNKDNCLTGVKDAREQAKLNDISVSTLFIFIGLGILLSRKFFYK